jgi:hypothetical protein
MALGGAEQLRRITNVVRKGRVTGITRHRIELEHGTEPALTGALYIDCTANIVNPINQGAWFGDDRLTAG